MTDYRRLRHHAGLADLQDWARFELRVARRARRWMPSSAATYAISSKDGLRTR